MRTIIFNMNIFLLSLVAVGAVAVALAIFLIGGSLLVAAMLPHGHPQVDRLRAFASAAPKKAWRWALALDTIFWIGIMAVFAYLTFNYS